MVGAIERAAVGNVVFPSLLSANAVAEPNWYLPALPAGGSTLGYIYALNPGSTQATATVHFGGSAGSATATLIVPANGLHASPRVRSPRSPHCAVRHCPRRPRRRSSCSAPTCSAHALAQPKPPTVKAVKRRRRPPQHASSASGAIGRALDVPTTTIAPESAAAALSALFGLPSELPIGYELSPGTVTSKGWLLPGGSSDADHGEYVSVTNPGTATATVTLETLAKGEATVIPNLGSVALAPGASTVVDLSRVLPPTAEVTVLASATAPVVVSAGFYAKGSSGSVGLSAPVAIPLD